MVPQNIQLCGGLVLSGAYHGAFVDGKSTADVWGKRQSDFE